jgi:hypothetical protein
MEGRKMKAKKFMLSAVVFLLLAVYRPAMTQAQLTIDDFTVGPHNVTFFSGIDENFQPSDGSPSLLSPGRLTRFIVDPAGNPLNQPATLDIGGGFFIVDTGARVFHRLEVFYGIDENLNPVPLNLNLSSFSKFRVHFDTLDQTLNFNLQVLAGNNPELTQCGVNQDGNPSGIPFFVEFDFACFVPSMGPPLDFSDIDFIDLIFQTGNVIGGHDYAITLVEAVP